MEIEYYKFINGVRTDPDNEHIPFHINMIDIPNLKGNVKTLLNILILLRQISTTLQRLFPNRNYI